MRIAAVAAVATAAVPWCLAPLGRMIRRSNGPGDGAALLWWPVDSWHFALPVVVGIVAGVVVGRAILLRRDLLKPALLGLAAIVLASILATVLSWSSMVKVYPDRIELTQRRLPGSADHTSVSLGRATGVEAYCYVERGRNKRTVAHLVYSVQLPEFGPVDLGAALLNPDRPSDDRLSLLQGFDTGVLRSVPGIGDGSQDAECLRLLHRRLGADQFTLARRLMKIDEPSYLRLYAEPHESWNGKADR
ncbi:hypothetical protein BH09PSE1_BH09PSE1_22300 [soil metagenome]